MGDLARRQAVAFEDGKKPLELARPDGARRYVALEPQEQRAQQRAEQRGLHGIERPRMLRGELGGQLEELAQIGGAR